MSWLAHNRNLLPLSAQSTRAAQLVPSALFDFQRPAVSHAGTQRAEPGQ